MRSEDEREYAREAARRVLAGAGLMTIARDWNTRGVPGACGGPWTAPTLRRVLLSSRIAGLREHGADPSGKTIGDLSPAVWPAALDRRTWDQVRAVLLNPERNTNVRKATRYLLTGLIHCGDCGGPLFSRPRNNTRRYLCAGRRPGHQLGIIADPVDELVKEFVLESLTTPSVREALLAQAGAGDDGTMGGTLADLGSAQSRLQGLDDDFYVRGVLAEGRYRSIRVKLEREIDRLHAMVDAGTKQRIVLHPDPRGFWAEADFQERRNLVRLMIQRVEVMPGRSALRRFDASRLRIQVSTLQPRTLLIEPSSVSMGRPETGAPPLP